MLDTIIVISTMFQPSVNTYEPRAPHTYINYQVPITMEPSPMAPLVHPYVP